MATRTISLQTAQQRMRAVVMLQARRVEKLVTDAVTAERGGSIGYAVCLRSIAKDYTTEAFRAAKTYQGQAAGRISLPLRAARRRKVA